MGQIYPAYRHKQNKTLVNTGHAWYTKEYADRMCSLYLEDEIVRNDKGFLIKNYRLHAKEPHSNEDVLAYSIDCPNCNNKLKQIGINKNCYELGLFTCPACNNEKERGW